jgi:hypothetical protein
MCQIKQPEFLLDPDFSPPRGNFKIHGTIEGRVGACSQSSDGVTVFYIGKSKFTLENGQGAWIRPSQDVRIYLESGVQIELLGEYGSNCY